MRSPARPRHLNHSHLMPTAHNKPLHKLRNPSGAGRTRGLRESRADTPTGSSRPRPAARGAPGELGPLLPACRRSPLRQQLHAPRETKTARSRFCPPASPAARRRPDPRPTSPSSPPAQRRRLTYRYRRARRLLSQNGGGPRRRRRASGRRKREPVRPHRRAAPRPRGSVLAAARRLSRGGTRGGSGRAPRSCVLVLGGESRSAGRSHR